MELSESENEDSESTSFLSEIGISTNLEAQINKKCALKDVIQPGGAINSWSMEYIGLYFQYIAVAVYLGSLSSMKYPVLKNLIGLQSYEVKGASNIINFWWCTKVFIGAFSDSFPIFGYRRKPYIIGGWALCIIITGVTIMLGNPVNQSDAWPWVLCFSSMTFAYVIADVATDGMITDLAQREPIEKRGQLQSNMYMIRFATSGIVGAIMAFTFNDKKYGGEFSWGFKVTQYLQIMLVIPIIGLYPFLRLKEPNVSVRKSYCLQIKLLYERIKLNAVWRVIVFSFMIHFFSSISNAAAYDIERTWCHVEPIADGLFTSILGHSLVAIGIYVTKKYFLNMSWRKILGTAIVYMVFTGYMTSLLVNLGFIRSPYFYVGAPLISSAMYGIFFITTSYCAVEVAQHGSEGIMYGLISTIGNMASPFSSLLSAYLTARFNLYDKNGVLKDDLTTRRSMIILDTVIMLINLLAIPTLLILPAQKKEIQVMIKSGASSKKWRAIVVSVLLFCFLWALVGNFLQIFKSTACLPVVGGAGC